MDEDRRKKRRQIFSDMIEDLGLKKGDSIYYHEMRDWYINNIHKGVKAGPFIIARLVHKFTTNSQFRYWSTVTSEDDLFYLEFEYPYAYEVYDKDKHPEPIYSIKDYHIRYGKPKFAYEKDLQNYLSKNLQIIDPGLRLYEDDRNNGIGYPAGKEFIDILAVDKENNFVVIELKVLKGHQRAVGQLTSYMGWIQKNLAEQNQKVRGIIIGHKISKRLKNAVSVIKNVELFEYNLSVEINKISLS